MIKILLDAGHGAGISHNRGGLCFNEGDNNFYYSLVLKAELEKYEGVKVDLVRNKITDNPSLAQRAAMAAGYDLFLSLHSNAAGATVRGTEIFDSVEGKNKVLADELVKVISNLFNHDNRGTKYKEGQPGYNWYGVLRFNKAKSAMIIEHGFHTNKDDCKFFKNNHKSIASETAKVVAKHYKLKSKAGWVKNNVGWWYRNDDGSYPKSQWKKISGKRYYFDSKGYMKTGWIKLKSKWYYLNSSGAMETGLINVKGKFYYLNSDGSMAADTEVTLKANKNGELT